MTNRSLRASITLVGLAALIAMAGCNRPEVLYPQFVKDEILVFTMNQRINEILSPTVSVLPLGEVDEQIPCENGTIHVTGTLSETPANDEYDLTYELSACQLSDDFGFWAADVVVNGQITVTGSWNKFTPEGFEELAADSLHISGNSFYQGHEDNFDLTCPFSLKISVNNISEAFSGWWCERPISASISHNG